MHSLAFIGLTATLAVAAPPPPSANTAAARAAASRKSLGLAQKAVDDVAAYRVAVDALTPMATAGAFCRMYDDAAALAAALQGPLVDRREQVFADAPALEAFIADVANLSQVLPGVHLAYGAETIYASRDDAALAKLAPAKAGGALLALAAPLTTTEWPAWLEQKTDVEGCVNAQAGLTVLAPLTKAWTATDAPCVKERIVVALARSVARLDGGALCGGKADSPAVESLAHALEAFPAEIGGKKAAAALRKAH